MRLVTVREAAQTLGISQLNIKKKLKSGRLAGKLTADGWMVDMDAIGFKPFIALDAEVRDETQAAPRAEGQEESEGDVQESRPNSQLHSPQEQAVDQAGEAQIEGQAEEADTVNEEDYVSETPKVVKNEKQNNEEETVDKADEGEPKPKSKPKPKLRRRPEGQESKEPRWYF